MQLMRLAVRTCGEAGEHVQPVFSSSFISLSNGFGQRCSAHSCVTTMPCIHACPGMLSPCKRG